MVIVVVVDLDGDVNLAAKSFDAGAEVDHVAVKVHDHDQVAIREGSGHS